MTEPTRAVFLSYASEDAKAAQRICDALRAAGIEVWFDQSELRGGDAWDAAIRKQIKSCALFIPVVSANTHARVEGYFRLEWKLAVDRSHLMAPDQAFLLPVVIDGTPQTDERIPDRFRELQWSRLPAGDTSSAFVERVSRLLASEPAHEPALVRSPNAPTPPVAAASRPARNRATSRESQRLRLLLAAVAVIGLGCFAVDMLWLSKRPAAGTGTSVSTDRAASPAQSAIPEKSIAVLPFANMSSDPAQDYLGDGIAAEITSKLSRLKGLLVKARTGVARYKGSTQSPNEIGAALGVSWLLEGSVARAGDHIRVTTTLLKAHDGFEVWSENADEKLDDIFTMQEHIAERTVEALTVTLTPEERRSLSEWGTHNAAAYDEYLQGEVLYESVTDRARFDASRPHFERALAIDPQFAPAMAGLASVEAQEYRDFDSDPARLIRADDLVRRALEIDPHLGRALIAAAELRVARYDYDGAAERFAQVTADEPENYVAWDLRCWAEGYRTPPHAAEAEQYCRRALQINPGHVNALYHLARALLQLGRVAEADRAIAKLDEVAPGSSLGISGHFWSELYQGRPQQALAALDRNREAAQTPLAAAWTAMAYGQLGELDLAFAKLDKALAGGYRDPRELRSSRWFAPLRKDRRFEPLLEKYGVRL
jgi:TolB-like protein/thioredoxin-like negative regulator of GroEL